MSGVGKGIATASIGNILQAKGFRVSCVKIDPYINVDAGTMNPLEHGEVFVTNDGTECDQDIGNYERFLDQDFSSVNYMTTGSVYESVITKERNLEYEGRCVEVVPHIPQEVISRIKKAGRRDKADFVLVEIGGTVGEYQNMLFLEAARMMKATDPANVLIILVTYLPVPRMLGEMKTKPTQNAVRALNAAGIWARIIIARSEFPVDEPRKEKISLFCNVEKEDIISSPDVSSVYEIPGNFEENELGKRILKKFGMRDRKSDMRRWKRFLSRARNAKKQVRIGIVGKYFETGNFTLMDSYISVIESIKHAAWANNRIPEITWLSAEEYAKNPRALQELKKFHGIVVPGGFGNRGVEGKMQAAGFCRKNNIPYFGLCLGMQLAVIEFARNVCGLKGAASTEFSRRAQDPVIDVLPEQLVLLKEKKYGGTMRLGAYPCRIQKGTKTFQAYKKQDVSERHRHRYELNNDYRDILEKKGMVMSGVNPERNLVEIMELKKHPFFVGTQFHPEFQSRLLKPHPLFHEFIRVSSLRKLPR